MQIYYIYISDRIMKNILCSPMSLV